MNKWTAFKLVLSIALIILLLRLVDHQELLATFKSLSIGFVIFITVAYLLGQALSAYKWHIILNTAGISTNYFRTCKAYILGMFANFFGLGIVGGDVARSLIITDTGDSKTQALATVVADRAHGLITLAAIGIVASILWGHAHVSLGLLIIIISFGLTLCLGWFIGPWLLLKLVNPTNRFRIKAEQLAEAFPKNKLIVLKITIISIVFHISQIAMHAVIANKLIGSYNLTAFLVAVPFVNILSSLPISWNGLGVREAGYMFFLTPEPFSHEHVISIGAIWLVATSLANIFGGALGLITGDFKRIKKSTK